MSEGLSLSEINVYPIKSLGGISLPQWSIEERGLKYDRRWMLVDSNNIFITQRKYPSLALLKTKFIKDGIEVSNIDHGAISFSFGQNTKDTSRVTVWDSVCDAMEVSKEANKYFSSYLNMEVRLVQMPNDSHRLVDPDYAFKGELVGFADAFPLLLIGQASLQELNSRLSSPVPMNRFRPNIVINTSQPFDEDYWMDFSVGNAKFSAVKPCARCVLTTINQETAEKGHEPLSTLAKYRTINNKVMFGQNILIREGAIEIKVGDKVIVHSRKN